MTTLCKIEPGPPPLVRVSRDHRVLVVFLVFCSLLFAGFAHAAMVTGAIPIIPSGLTALGAILAFNKRTDVVFDSSDKRIYVTTRSAVRTIQKIWYPYCQNKLQIEKLWCADRMNNYRNHFIVLNLPDRKIPVFHDPKESVTKDKLSEIIETLG